MNEHEPQHEGEPVAAAAPQAGEAPGTEARQADAGGAGAERGCVGGCSRRAILKCGAAAAALPALSTLGCAPRVATPLAIDVAAPAGTIVSVALSRVPEILTTGASLLLHPEGLDSTGRPLSFLVANLGTKGLVAFDGYCTHSSCEVAWDADAGEVVCPCHLSRFDVAGRVLRAPAKDDLTPYAARIQHENSLLSVDIGDVALPPAFPSPVDGRITITLDDLPDLKKVGGAVTGHAKGVVFPLVVLRAAVEKLVAYDARCTHQGCTVYGAGSQLLICKCHGSLFSTADGSVKLGPAVSPPVQIGPLAQLPVLSFDGATGVILVGP